MNLRAAGDVDRPHVIYFTTDGRQPSWKDHDAQADFSRQPGKRIHLGEVVSAIVTFVNTCADTPQPTQAEVNALVQPALKDDHE